MRPNDLKEAMKEARRFIEKAQAALDRTAGDSTLAEAGCRETAAARRASMDLTKSLADLRMQRK